MKIVTSQVQVTSKHTEITQRQHDESLQIWQNRSAQPAEQSPEKSASQLIRDRITISYQQDAQPSSSVEGLANLPRQTDSEAPDLNMRLLESLYEKLTGRKAIVIRSSKASAPLVANRLSSQANVNAAEQRDTEIGFGFVYTQHTAIREIERSEFSASGSISTAEGRSINFTTSLSMKREFSSEQSVSIRAGSALKDPLVINFNGSAANLSEQKVAFDIDGDGRREDISFVSPESGFLALDKNSDGTINNGLELFGTKTGNGFEELSAFDSDGNHWIDENDAIFSALRIWSKDEQGNDRLETLKNTGIGAFYLERAVTPFSVRSTDNAVLGEIRETGLAILENGQAITMQQIDLAV